MNDSPTRLIILCGACARRMPAAARIGLVIACLGGSQTVCRAEDAAAGTSSGSAAPALAGSVAPSLVSDYVFRGQLLGKVCLQTNLSATAESFGMGIWSSLPVGPRIANQSDPEIDPYGYCRIPVNDRWAVIPGFEIYTYPDASTSSLAPGFVRTRFEANVTFETRAAGVTVLTKFAYDAILKGEVGEITGLYGVPLASLGTEIDLKVTGGAFIYHDAVNRIQPAAEEFGAYGQAGFTVPYQISASSRVALGYAYSEGRGGWIKAGALPKYRDPLEASRGIASVAFTWSF